MSEQAELTEQEQADLKDALEQRRMLKKTLKQLGKNQLIDLVLQQVGINIEQQASNKYLIEALRKYEAEAAAAAKPEQEQKNA